MLRKTGAEYLGEDKTKFTVWAPLKKKVQLILKGKEKPVDLVKDNKGYWETEIAGITPGDLYKFKIEDDEEFPDPASRSQPEGVHSWSRVIDSHFNWDDAAWKGIPISEMIIYELHVGTFTPEGTFEAIIGKLDHLLELGINTIEIMPVSQFPGSRNWGYDGVYPFAAQHSYGGAEGLKKLVNSCHDRGIAVLLDVVYNHMGPEGNYLSQYGPYFTEKYQTPWGAALNFDDKYSDEVRNFFLQNGIMWLEEFHLDGLRLDAIHEIIDRGAKHLLKELSQRVDELEEQTGRKYVLIAESDLNDIRVVNEYEKGGYGLEGQWVDDFHHSLHSLLTGEKEGYYKDYGKLEHLAKSFEQAFVYDGTYSDFRKRTVGNSPVELPPSRFVICIQNHDQVGNRMLGERISDLVSFEALKLAAGTILTAPFVPMLFMGEEFGEKRPFKYFVSHGDPDLVKAVREGRKREFQYFFDGEGDFPDPQGEETFEESKLDWNFREDRNKNIIFEFYKHLLHLKKQGEFKAFGNSAETDVFEEQRLLIVSANGETGLFGAFNFSKKDTVVKPPLSKNKWEVVVFSGDKRWNGQETTPSSLENEEKFSLPPTSFVIYKTRQ